MDAAIVRDTPIPGVGRVLAGAGLAGIGAGAGVLWYFDPTKGSFFPVCPLLAVTGFACPGCGLTRAFHALLHGDITTAIDYNALIPVVAFAALFVVVTLVSIAVRGRGLMKLSASPKFLGATLVLLLAFGVLRNLPFYPFTFLYP